MIILYCIKPKIKFTKVFITIIATNNVHMLQHLISSETVYDSYNVIRFLSLKLKSLLLDNKNAKNISQIKLALYEHNKDDVIIHKPVQSAKRYSFRIDLKIIK